MIRKLVHWRTVCVALTLMLAAVAGCPEETDNDVEDAAEEVGDAMEDAGDEVGDAVEDAAEATDDAMKDADDELEDMAEDTEDAMENAAEATGDALEDAADETEDAADEASDELSKLTDDLRARPDVQIDDAVRDQVRARLAKMDAADGNEDEVVKLCSSCRLGMDGHKEHMLEVAGYTMWFCSDYCMKKVAQDPGKEVLAVVVPDDSDKSTS